MAAYQFGTQMWSELSPEEKATAGTRAQHQAAKAKYETRMANKAEAQANNEDLTPTKVTRSELKETVNEDTTIKDLRAIQNGDDVLGAKAQKFLGKQIEQKKAAKQARQEQDMGTQGLSDYGDLSAEDRVGVDKRQYNRRTDQGSHSKYDIKTRVKGGADLAELEKLEASGTVTDPAAQKFLNKRLNQMRGAAAPIEPEPEPEKPVDTAPGPVDKAPGPVDTTPDPVDTDKGGGDDGYDDGGGSGGGDGGDYGGGGGGGNNGGGGGGGGAYLDQDVDNSQEQNVNQENDVIINGDGNNWVNQDNSNRQYGGDNRIFNYVRGGDGGGGNGSGGGSGGWFDSPASMATMGGFYEVNDSPAKQAAFTDLHSDLNTQKQQRYAGMGKGIANMYSGFDARAYNPVDFKTAIEKSTQRSYDRATSELGYTFGDMWNKDFAPTDWVMPDAPSEIKNDDDLGDKEVDDIEDA